MDKFYEVQKGRIHLIEVPREYKVPRVPQELKTRDTRGTCDSRDTCNIIRSSIPKEMLL